MSSLQQFQAEIAGIEWVTDPDQVANKSRDYYWYSPILKEQLDGKTGDLVVRPRTEAEVIRIAAACAKHRLKITVRGGGTGTTGNAYHSKGE
jgi:FAD/FMN-containing dehydrogenase